MNHKNSGDIQKLAYSRAEAAEKLSISISSLDRLTKRGLIKPSRAMYRPTYAHCELERFLRETTVCLVPQAH